MKNFGYEFNADASGWGIDLGLNMDISGGYKFPLYDEFQFIVQKFALNFLAGGRSWFTLALKYMKVHLFVDIIGYELVPLEILLKLDTITYKQYCTAVNWQGEALKFKVSGQIDIDECTYGFIGAFFTGFTDCQWNNYYIDYPFYEYDY